MKDLTISAIATVIAEFLTLPICTLKTNYQNTRSTSIINTAKKMYSKQGLKSFYRSSLPSISSQVISTSSKYYLYRKFEDTKYFNSFINGSISGIISSLATHPIDVIKINLQMNHSLYKTIRENNLSLFYRGYSKTFSKVIVASSLFFPLYDKIKMSTNNILLSSFLSGTISNLIIHPIDYLKTRHIYGQSFYHGLNPLPYYKGFTLSYIRIVPHFMIVMSIIEYIKDFF